MLQKMTFKQFKKLLSSILQCYSLVQLVALSVTDFLINFSASLFKAVLSDNTVGYSQVNKMVLQISK